MSNLDEYVLKPSADAVVAFAGTVAVIGSEGEIDFGPATLSTPLALAATAYLTNIGFNVLKDQMKKTQTGAMVNLEVGIMGPVVNGALMTAIAYGIMGPYSSTQSMLKVFAVGAAANMVGPYIHDTVAPSLM